MVLCLKVSSIDSSKLKQFQLMLYQREPAVRLVFYMINIIIKKLTQVQQNERVVSVRIK